MRARARDRGFSLVEAMVASVVMLIGLLGLAALQIAGARANNLGKRMAQASLLAQDLVQNINTIWQYNDPRLTPQNFTTSLSCSTATNCNDPTHVQPFWDVGRAQVPSSVFDYSDGALAGSATVLNALTYSGTSYEGVTSPVDTTLAAGEQIIFTRYWNVFSIQLNGSTENGKLIQVVVRWKEAALSGYRQVTTSFYKYNPSVFTNQ
jgi:hypothetical protein